MQNVRPRVPSVQSAPGLPGLPISRPVRLRASQAGQCELVLGLLAAWGQAGSANPNRKGGRTKHHAGYLMVRMPDHPRARTQGYVFEHILVMEARLGRMLFVDESVHHKNGIRDDNSPEDLELWVRPQPSGIRAVDALAWAREIINRYGELN